MNTTWYQLPMSGSTKMMRGNLTSGPMVPLIGRLLSASGALPLGVGVGVGAVALFAFGAQDNSARTRMRALSDPHR